jgi:acetyl-CoA C-acetyltransferase
MPSAATTIHPRTPVLVGAGQIQAGGDAPDPVVLLAEACRRAAAPRLLERADSIRVIRIVSRGYPDPARLLGEELRAVPEETVYTYHGGHNPQLQVAHAAWDIFRGAAEFVILGGAESWRTRRALKRRGAVANWLTQDRASRPTRVIGDPLPAADPAEAEIGFGDPVQAYPLFEVAWRAARRLSPDEHIRRISELWSRFSAVAAANPHARVRAFHDAHEIRTVSESNRMVGYPYPKLLVANDDVDQAAALVLCSVERARSLGIPADQWVFIHGAGQAADTPAVSNRWDLARSPAIAAAGAAALRQAQIGVNDVAYLDVYSCFPCAVEIAAAELGLGLDRQLTVTGGLTFAGGPWNNYSTHAIAALHERLIADPGSYGLCTANGGLLTRQAVGVYSTAPPGSVPVAPSVWQGTRARTAVPDYEGPAALETYTVMHDREGAPTVAYLACLTPDGSRALVASRRPEIHSALLAGAPHDARLTLGGPSGVSLD